MNTYYSTCIYTMKNSVDLKKAYNSGVINTFVENQIWRTGYNEFIKSKNQQENMLIIFSKAEEQSGIAYIGFLTDIFIDELNKHTQYSFLMLSELKESKPLSKLKLLSTNKQLSNDYIRPYAIVKLPLDISNWQTEDTIKEIALTKKSGNETFIYNKSNLDKSL